jgi:putative ABC transport system permease protein
MLQNFFKVAWRNLIKHKFFSLINIFGLASGMTICMLSLMQIKGAYDYDTFHPHADRSFRINTSIIKKDGQQFLAAYSPLPLRTYLKENYPEISQCTRILFANDDITTNAKRLYAKEAYVDPDFYNIFGFQLKTGTPATTAQTVVVTEETATRFFGNENPIGQALTLGKKGDFIVTGVLKTAPHPSHLQFDVLAFMPVSEPKKAFIDWSNETAGYTYIQLKPQTARTALKTILQQASNVANTSNINTERTFAFEAQPLPDIVPAMKPISTTTAEIPFRNLVAFAAIGAAMLLLAFFNYINLTLARSLDRAREVGVRKVAGAFRRQLVLQFLCESVLTAACALLMAVLLLRIISNLPTIQRLTHNVAEDGKLWLYFALFTLVTGLLAGWIPARVLSSFQPVRVLKGKFNAKLFGGIGLRRAMTVTQFTVSLIALITLVVFYTQARYMATADYGFAREGILNIPVPAAAYTRTATAFASVAGVEQVSATSELFGFFGGDRKFIRQEIRGDSLAAAYYSVTPSFIQTMGLQFVAGENLSISNTEQAARFVVVNEEACRQLQFKNPADAVGKELWLNDSTSYRVSGVLKDFHYASFQRFINPLLMVYNPTEFTTLNLKIAAGAEKAILPKLESAWQKLYPHQPLEMDWYDKALYDQHLHEDDLVFIGLLTGMALSIACLGLLGMVLYTTKNRAKEVSIRKVMGAAVSQIVLVVSKEFFMLLLIAVSIGLPLGFLTGMKFLQQYAYRIPISAGLLAGCGGALLLVGGITIGWQTLRTATANPVKHLRAE